MSVGGVDRRRTEPVALAAKGVDRVGGQGARVDVLTLGIDCEQRAACAVERVDPANWKREVQAAGAADRDGIPGVLLAGGQDTGGIGAGRDAHDGAEVSEVAGILEQDDRRVAALDGMLGSEGWATRDRRDARVVCIGPELAVDLVRHGGRQLAQARADIGRQLGCEPLELRRLAGQHGLDLAAEAQRVLERMEALQHGPAVVAARLTEAVDQTALGSSLLHNESLCPTAASTRPCCGIIATVRAPVTKERPYMLRRSVLLAVAAIGILVALPVGAQAASGPHAVAAKSCSLAGKTRSLGPTYTTSLSVRKVSCSKGESLVKAYYACRKRNGGKRGRCRRVSGYSCSERRYDSIPTQFSATATCKKGGKKVVHKYTQFT